MFSANTSQVSNDVKYIEDFFSAWLRTGTGSSQTVTTGIKENTGALVISKSRSAATDWAWYDTFRGATKDLASNTTAAETTQSQGLTAFNTDGHTWGTLAKVNTSGATYVDFVLKPTPKFFDVVTYTGDGVTTGRQISHSLGSTPGVMIVKSYGDAGLWLVYHRSLGNTQYLQLSATDAATAASTAWNNTDPNSTTFTVGSYLNGSGKTYIAYLFAHDAGGFGLTGTDNVISCGSYTGNGSATGPEINLGYEPQWVLIKDATNASPDWWLFDNMRGVATGGVDMGLRPNTSGAEVTANNYLSFTATGFQPTTTTNTVNQSGDTYIYIAIRRGPMKTPTSGTSVLSLQTYTGDDSTRTLTTGFPVDLAIGSSLSSSAGNSATFEDRLRGKNTYINTSSTGAEVSGGNSVTGFDVQTGIAVDGPSNYLYNYGSIPYVLPALRRAPGFFDEVCYTGTGSARTVTHNLGVAPELMILKTRTGSSSEWPVYAAPLGATQGLYLGPYADPAITTSSYWNNTSPTSSVFTVGNASAANLSGSNFVAYLFASCPGVSKIGSYTGTGAAQTIACGFTGGARFVLIKRTDSTGDWYVYDTARGMVSGNDPYLLWNANGNQVTGTNYVFTSSTGFTIQASAPVGINASGGSYIYLAIA